MDGRYSVPGGVKESSETLLEAVVRETYEEVGINVDSNDVDLVHVMHNYTTGEEWIGSFFTTDKWQGTPRINEPHKHTHLRWVPITGLPKNMSPYIRQAIGNYRNGLLYSEFGWSINPDADENVYMAINNSI